MCPAVHVSFNLTPLLSHSANDISKAGWDAKISIEKEKKREWNQKNVKCQEISCTEMVRSGSYRLVLEDFNIVEINLQR